MLYPQVLSVLASVTLATSASTAQTAQRVVAYVPNWIDLPAFAETIDYAKVTHLNVAFENPVNDEGDLSFDPKDAALIAKAREHGVPVLVSIGGGGASGNKTLLMRYAALLGDADRRAGFVKKLAGYVTAYSFAGLDVDLEGPGIPPGYGPFVVELADALQGQGKLVTAALPKRYAGGKIPDAALARFDFVNIMAYDATGPWRPDEPGQHSSLELARDSVQYWLGRGLPKDKAVLGVPFYGYGCGRAFRGDHDYAYKELLERFPGADQQDQVGETIWYNGQPTIRAKAAFVRAKGLGGVMIWSLDQDTTPGTRSLLDTVYKELHRREN